MVGCPVGLVLGSDVGLMVGCPVGYLVGELLGVNAQAFCSSD